MVDQRAPVTHPWLGELRWYQPDELLGQLDIDPAVRPPALDGSRDIEVLVEVMPGITGTALAERLDQFAVQVHDALERLAALRQFTVDRAPAGWAARYAPLSGSLADLLFLDGVEADPAGGLSLVFDFGDLDQLVTRLDEQGNGAEVRLRA